MKVVIVDDEKPARQRFRRLLSECQGIDIVGEGETGVDAITLVSDLKPDVVFLDIDMPVLSGLEAGAALAGKQTMIVFVTAYDQYALNAFETNAVDYLVKPVEKERLDKTIERLQARMNESLPAKNFSKVVADFTTEKKMIRLAVRAGNKIEIIALSAISMINALDGYAEIFHGERKSLSDDTLESLEERLGPAFIRIHRSVIINLDFLKELTREGDRKYTAHLKDYYENSCPVSREALKKLQNRLGII